MIKFFLFNFLKPDACLQYYNIWKVYFCLLFWNAEKYCSFNLLPLNSSLTICVSDWVDKGFIDRVTQVVIKT